MNMQSILSQLSNMSNPQNMIQQMIKANPNLQNAWNTTQQILNSGASKQDMIKAACQKSSTDVTAVTDTLKNNGISI